MAKSRFDVCVVGSGPGGGIAAHVLTKAGLKVALVEAGPKLRAGIDYNTHADIQDVYEKSLQTGTFPPSPQLRMEENHFTPVGDRPRHGLLKALGGRSLCWAGHSLRFGPIDFKQWPIGYDSIAPYYSLAERFMGVHGYKDGLENLPDGEFLKPVPMRCPEAALGRGVQRLKTKGRRMEFIAQRKAILTEDHWSQRAVCHYCGRCMKGCCVEAKYTSANTPIPLAQATGNLTLYSNATMTRILMDSTGQRIAGIEYAAADGKTEKIEAKSLVLACSAIETTRHLLLNKTKEFPEGLANSSGLVGRQISSHFGLWVVGYFQDLRHRDISNDDGTDYFHSLLTGLYWDKPHPKFEGTYQVQCGAGVSPYRLMIQNVRGYGAAFKRELLEKNAGHVGMNMQGMLLISSKKFIDLDPQRKDRFGLPLPRIHLHYEDSDVAMAQDMVNACEEIILAAGGEILDSPSQVTPKKLIIDSNHWVGGVKMGSNPKHSVVNLGCQSHDIPNLFIGDAAVFPANPEKNPTLTNIALSWRMSDNLVEKFRRGELS